MLSPSMDTVDLLSRTGIVAGMTPEQIQVLAALGKVENVCEGDPLVSLDESSSDLIVILEGRCEIRTTMNDVLSRLGEGSLIGEVSFIDHKPRSAKAVAVGA